MAGATGMTYMMTHTTTTQAEELLFRAGLLAGMGAAARGAARAALAPVEAAGAATSRTCIDAGDPLLFSVAAPGGRALRVAVRQAQAVGDGMRHWRRFVYSAGAPERPPQAVDTILVEGEPAAAWQTARDWLGPAATAPQLAPARALLGGRGRIYLVARPARLSAPGDGSPGWIAWHLDHRAAPAEALAALGLAGVWPQVRHWYGKLLGAPVSERARPWSIGVSLGDGPPRLRVGTTHWARQPESPAKSGRLGRVVGELGGDGRYAEALYKLVAGAWPERRAHGIGAVAEFEFEDGQLRAAEFFIRARLPVEEVVMPPEEQAGWNKLHAETLMYLGRLAPGENPIVPVFVELASTPSTAEMATMDALGLTLNPSAGPIHTGQIPARAIPALAALASISTVEVGVGLGLDSAFAGDYDVE